MDNDTVFDLIDRHNGFANLRPLIFYILLLLIVWFIAGCEIPSYQKMLNVNDVNIGDTATLPADSFETGIFAEPDSIIRLPSGNFIKFEENCALRSGRLTVVAIDNDRLNNLIVFYESDNVYSSVFNHCPSGHLFFFFADSFQKYSDRLAERKKKELEQRKERVRRLLKSNPEKAPK